MKERLLKKVLAALLVAGLLTGYGIFIDPTVSVADEAAADESNTPSDEKPWYEYVNVDWKESSIELSTGINLTYLTIGPKKGKAVILIHGATDSRVSWSQVAPKLAAKGYRVYVPELRGHGKTDKPEDDAYTLNEHASDIKAFIKALGLKKVNLVGHSLGTFISEKIAIDKPKLVSSLTLIGAGYKVKSNAVIDWVLNGDGESFPGVNAFVNGGEIPDTFIREWTATVNENADFAEATYRHAKGLPSYAWGAIFNGLNGTDLSSKLKKIKAPVTIIWGTEDIVFPENEQKQLKKLLKNAKTKLVKIKGADHNTHWASNKIAEKVAGLIASRVGK